MAVAAPLHAASHAHADKKAEAKAAAKPIPKEDAAISHGTVSVHGHAVHYTATAGHLLIRNDDGDATATVFYVAYTADGAHAGKRRSRFCTTAARALRPSGCTWARSGPCA